MHTYNCVIWFYMRIQNLALFVCTLWDKQIMMLQQSREEKGTSTAIVLSPFFCISQYLSMHCCYFRLLFYLTQGFSKSCHPQHFHWIRFQPPTSTHHHTNFWGTSRQVMKLIFGMQPNQAEHNLSCAECSGFLILNIQKII